MPLGQRLAHMAPEGRQRIRDAETTSPGRSAYTCARSPLRFGTEVFALPMTERRVSDVWPLGWGRNWDPRDGTLR